jgi:hypothetical protein
MTKEQAYRLDAIVAKNELSWWEIQEKIGVENLNNTEAIERAITVLEKMYK